MESLHRKRCPALRAPRAAEGRYQDLPLRRCGPYALDETLILEIIRDSNGTSANILLVKTASLSHLKKSLSKSFEILAFRVGKLRPNFSERNGQPQGLFCPSVVHRCG